MQETEFHISGENELSGPSSDSIDMYVLPGETLTSTDVERYQASRQNVAKKIAEEITALLQVVDRASVQVAVARLKLTEPEDSRRIARILFSNSTPELFPLVVSCIQYLPKNEREPILATCFAPDAPVFYLRAGTFAIQYLPAEAQWPYIIRVLEDPYVSLNGPVRGLLENNTSNDAEKERAYRLCVEKIQGHAQSDQYGLRLSAYKGIEAVDDNYVGNSYKRDILLKALSDTEENLFLYVIPYINDFPEDEREPFIRMLEQTILDNELQVSSFPSNLLSNVFSVSSEVLTDYLSEQAEAEARKRISSNAANVFLSAFPLIDAVTNIQAQEELYRLSAEAVVVAIENGHPYTNEYVNAVTRFPHHLRVETYQRIFALDKPHINSYIYGRFMHLLPEYMRIDAQNTLRERLFPGMTLEEIAADTPLYKKHPEPFYKNAFDKDGAPTTLLGSRTGLQGKVIIRHYGLEQYRAWVKAYEDTEAWKRAGFDYVPIEPIVRMRAEKKARSVALFTRVLGPNAQDWIDIGGPFVDEILDMVARIKTGLQEMNVHHGHPHMGNFCLVFEKDPDGKPDLTVCPQVYMIDFDRAYIGA